MLKYVLTFFFTGLISTAFSQNHAPIAVNDSVECAPGESIEVNVLLNDYDPDGDSIKIFNQPMGDSTITITLHMNSTFLLTGYMEFLYFIMDQYGNISDSSKAYVVVKILNDAVDWLDVNNVRASLNAYGKQFQGGQYFIPADQGTSSFYCKDDFFVIVIWL